MIEVRCPNCNRLLFKAETISGPIEIKCQGCKRMVVWPSNKAEVVEDRPPRKPTLVQE